MRASGGQQERREIDRLKQENERLHKELEAALRASKRQAAPHSRGEPKAHPNRPGRKPDPDYGQQAQTQQILVSVLRTCWQQDKDPFSRLVWLLRSPGTEILDIVPGAD